MGDDPCAITDMNNEDVLRAVPHLLGDEDASRLAKTFRVLGDPTRVRIVSLLAEAELCVRDLAAALGMSQSAISHQLRTLRNMRLVRRWRVGRQIFYTLDDEHVVDLFRRALQHVGHE